MTLLNRDAAIAVVSLHGHLDPTTGGGLRGVTNEALRSGYLAMVLDLSAVTVVDAAGLDALVEAHEQVAAAGGSLRIRRPGPAVRRALALAGIDARIAVEP